jgi:hypothetical protein
VGLEAGTDSAAAGAGVPGHARRVRVDDTRKTITQIDWPALRVRVRVRTSGVDIDVVSVHLKSKGPSVERVQGVSGAVVLVARTETVTGEREEAAGVGVGHPRDTNNRTPQTTTLRSLVPELVRGRRDDGQEDVRTALLCVGA